MSYSTRWRAKKPSLTLNLGTNGLKVTYEPPPMVGQAGCLQGLDLSAVTHPSSSHARRCLIQLFWDNHCTRYTAPLTCGLFKVPASIDHQLFVMESVITKVLLPEPLSISARLILSYSCAGCPFGRLGGPLPYRPTLPYRTSGSSAVVCFLSVRSTSLKLPGVDLSSSGE
ncbi:hypothetical protein J6590_086893 [Homalodisca vitripennis]|nr:hypothetical protein J6590_086893 [Homalodisca vitripennis]